MSASLGKRCHGLVKVLCGTIAIISAGLPTYAAAQDTSVAAQGTSGAAQDISVALQGMSSGATDTSGAAKLQTQSDYLISAGDELDVFVWGEQSMQRTVRVQPDGTFSFPMAGTIQAVGRNVAATAADIKSRIAPNYRAAVPDVTVSVRTTAGTRFYVVGKVRTPGSYTSATSIDILQALSMAGGAEPFADIKNAVILRRTPTGQVVEPVKLATILKGRRALNTGTLSTPLPTLMSGDVLVIP